MELNAGETILFEGHPSWRSGLGFFAKGLVLAVIVGLALGFGVAAWAGIVGGAVVFAITIGISALLRYATDYAITNERLHIRRGILSKTTQETRLGRVQNVTVSQSVWERLLRIGRADFDTASEEQNDFLFAGIANPDQVRAAVDKAHRLAESRGGSDDRPVPGGNL
jgi:uncharacterized membrane protein YdbT with pleckstrin-like domain